MICTKCGKKLDEGDKFCKNCGTDVNKQITLKHILRDRVWFRLVTVIYIIVIVIITIIIGYFSLGAKPQKTIDGDNSSIACNNGKSYAPSRNSIYLYGSESELGVADDQDARILCKYDSLNFYSHYNEFIEKNYTFLPVYKEMDYGSWVGYTLLAFFILWVFATLAKMSFLYIAIGEKPKINFPQ